MSLLIYTATDGARLQADPKSFASIAELKLWIEEKAKVAVASQILLTSRGTNLKEQYLANERELFLYNRRAIDPAYKPAQTPLPPPPKLPQPPLDLQSHSDHSSWMTLFQKRLQWTESLVTNGKILFRAIDDMDECIKTMQSAIEVAFTSHQNHISGSRKRLEEKQTEADDILRAQEEVFTSWEHSIRMAAQIPVHPNIASVSKRATATGRAQVSVADLINHHELKNHAPNAELLAQEFVSRMNDLRAKVEKITSDTESLYDEIRQIGASTTGNYLSDDPKTIVEELEVLAGKIRADYERLRDTHSLGQISKCAHYHTKEVLPNLQNQYLELHRLYQQAVQQKNYIAVTCIKHFQYISHLQSRIGQVVNPSFEEATLKESESFRVLNRAYKLPFIYGALLVECVRRREWTEKVSGDSRRLAEDLAAIRDEEEKRRKKWQKQIGMALPFSMSNDAKLLDLEINLHSGDDGWPAITRQDVENFIDVCKGIDGTQELLKEITQMFQDLDKPLRRLAKRIKGFKSGSLHEAAMANSALLTDEAKDLQAKNSRLEERCRNYESRIRRLEDLLHKSFGRTNSGPLPYQVPTSPLAQSPMTSGMMGMNGAVATPIGSRPGTMASRRLSGTEQSEKEKLLATQVLALESQLTEQKEALTRLEKEATEHLDAEKKTDSLLAEAENTKRDLIGNLEAQQNEFNIERKALRDQIEELKMKLDEADEELDRLEEFKSVELHKKDSMEERIRNLEAELQHVNDELVQANTVLENVKFGNEQQSERWKKEHEEQLDTVRREKDTVIQQLRADLKTFRTRIADLELTVKVTKEDNSRHTDIIYNLEHSLKTLERTLSDTKKELAERDASLLSTAKEIYRRVSDEPAPNDLKVLLTSADTWVAKIVAHNEGLESNLAEHMKELNQYKSALQNLQSRFDSRTIRAKDLTQRLYTNNVRSTQLLESLGFSIIRRDNSMQIVRIPKERNSESIILSKNPTNPPETTAAQAAAASPSKLTSSTEQLTSSMADFRLLYWMEADDSDVESEKYAAYLNSIGIFDLDAFSDAVIKRVKEAEHMARKWQKEARVYREKSHRYQAEAYDKIAYKSFKEGDLALFLPTRNSVNKPWAAFNVGAPHYFLREQETHRLKNRDWLLARISKVEERVVDLSRSTSSLSIRANPSVTGTSDAGSVVIDDENPFELSDGLRWYLLDANEEKPGAPTTPGLSPITVSSSKVDVKGSLRSSRKSVVGAKTTLTNLKEGEAQRRRGSSSSANRHSITMTPEETAAALVSGGRDIVVSRAATPAPPMVSGNVRGGLEHSVSSPLSGQMSIYYSTLTTLNAADGNANGTAVSKGSTSTKEKERDQDKDKSRDGRASASSSRVENGGIGHAEKIAEMAATLGRSAVGVWGSK